jgi:valyl-tRNA synthetase
MICGFVMAKKGEKISKSKNNSTMSPKALIDRYSADGLRYWASGAKLGTDTMFDEEELRASGRFLTKLWNAARFTLMHLKDFNGQKPGRLMPVDSWIIQKLGDTMLKAEGYLKQYETGSARHEIDNFFWNDFCDNYLEIIKERLYQPEKHGIENRQSAQYGLYMSFLGIIKLYAAYVPHMAEEIYQAYFYKVEKCKSVHLLIWSIPDRNGFNLLAFGERLKQLISEVRRYKSERSLSLKVQLDRITVRAAAEDMELFNATQKDLKACTAADDIRVLEGDAFEVEVG